MKPQFYLESPSVQQETNDQTEPSEGNRRWTGIGNSSRNDTGTRLSYWSTSELHPYMEACDNKPNITLWFCTIQELCYDYWIKVSTVSRHIWRLGSSLTISVWSYWSLFQKLCCWDFHEIALAYSTAKPRAPTDSEKQSSIPAALRSRLSYGLHWCY